MSSTNWLVISQKNFITHGKINRFWGQRYHRRWIQKRKKTNFLILTSNALKNIIYNPFSVRKGTFFPTKKFQLFNCDVTRYILRTSNYQYNTGYCTKKKKRCLIELKKCITYASQLFIVSRIRTSDCDNETQDNRLRKEKSFHQKRVDMIFKNKWIDP